MGAEVSLELDPEYQNGNTRLPLTLAQRAAVREALGVNAQAVTVADKTARQTLATYTALGVTVEANALSVYQENEEVDERPTVRWDYKGPDLADDDSWDGVPLTNAEGNLVGPIQIDSSTLAEVTGTVPEQGRLMYLTDTGGLLVGDEETVAENLVPVNGRPTLHFLRTPDLNGDLILSIDPRYDYVIMYTAAGTVSGDFIISGSPVVGQKIKVFIGTWGSGSTLNFNTLNLGMGSSPVVFVDTIYSPVPVFGAASQVGAFVNIEFIPDISGGGGSIKSANITSFGVPWSD